MKYRPTVLNISVGLFLIGILIYTIVNHKILFEGEGWGIVFMFGLTLMGLLGGFIDLALQTIIRNTKLLNIIGSVVVALALGLIIISSLSFESTQKSDIDFGNQLISHIETYKLENGKLPETDDWKTLTALGFKIELTGTKPAYTKIDDENYELVYLEGFDGPYLLWNSKTKEWKVDFPAIPDRN